MSTEKPWVWLRPDVMLAVHDEQLAEHGGPSGVREMALFESAMARAQQLAAYTQLAAAELAAAYGYGIARNLPFIDGNKRTAFVAMELFLMLNGFRLRAADVDCVGIMLQVAEGSVTEPEFAEWIESNIESDDAEH
jgi:death on curing protein